MPRLTHRARKDLERLPAALLPKAEAVIGRLDSDPHLGKKLLGGLNGLRSVRLGRSHRLLYRLDADGPLVMTVLPRRDAYR